MFWNKSDVNRPGALRSSKLRLENLEERQLLTAVGLNDVPYGPEPAPVVCEASDVNDEAGIDLSDVDDANNCSSPLVTTANVTLTVTSSASSGAGSLRQAIADASDGDTIKFDSNLKGSTIYLAGSQLEITKSLTIDALDLYDSENGTPGITINGGDSSGNNRGRVMYVDAGTIEEPVVLKGLTITGGYATDTGGGIYVASRKALSTEDVTISSNSVICSRDWGSPAGGGGVCIAFQGVFTATNTTITGNTVENDEMSGRCLGGGVYVDAGTFTATNTTITKNSAKLSAKWGSGKCEGGGVYVDSGTFTATCTTISENSLYARKTVMGGGVSVWFGSFTATSTTISKNVANSGGVTRGGGVYINGATFTATNTTIAGNQALGSDACGGGIWIYYATYVSYNSIVAGNKSATSDTDICNVESIIKAGNSLSSYNLGAENGNIVPASEQLAGLFNDPENGDYSLKAGSVAIDAGGNKYVDGSLKECAPVEVDFDGNYRICQGKSDSTATVDIGAYEYQPETQYDHQPMAIYATTTEDVVDPLDRQISLREAIQYAADGDTINLVVSTFNVASAITLDKSITLNGNDATINGGNSTRIFEVAANKEVTISDVTLQKGKAGTEESPENGGAIVNNGTLTLTNVTAIKNVATKNGGVVFNNVGANLTISGGTFGQENGANSARNGGAFANYGTMNISGTNKTLISDNTAQRFGGAYFGCGTLNVTGVAEFVENGATEGGAIYNDVRKDAEENVLSKGSVSITGTVDFTRNTASEKGGAIISYSTLGVAGTTSFNGNEADKYGGAIDVGTGGEATLGGNLTFSQNGTSDANKTNFGGAIFSTGALTFLDKVNEENSTFTFTENTAKSGGAIDACAGTLTLAGKFIFQSNAANGDYDEDNSGLGGGIATAADTTVADGTDFTWSFNSATYGTCVAVNTKDLGAEKFGLNGAPANSYSLFKAKEAEVTSPAATMIPQMIEAGAVAATITVDGVSTTFGEEGVTPKALGLGAGTYDALVQYTDADGATSEVYSLVLTVGEGASIDVCETTIANGRGVKFDFNLTKADGRAVSVWEISWGDGTTTRSDNLSN